MRVTRLRNVPANEDIMAAEAAPAFKIKVCVCVYRARKMDEDRRYREGKKRGWNCRLLSSARTAKYRNYADARRRENARAELRGAYRE